MTAATQSRINVALALAVPAAGLAYLTAGDALSGRFAIASIVALGVLWLSATAAVNTLPRRRLDGVRTRAVVEPTPPRAMTPASQTYVDVSRPVTRWRWTDALLVPVEGLAAAWSVGLLVLLLIVPVGLALAGALWVSRLVQR